MAVGDLAKLKYAISAGKSYYTCQERDGMNWYLGSSLDETRERARETARAFNSSPRIYQVVDPSQIWPGGEYFFVHKMLEPGPRGELRCQWGVADSLHAAEMLRDVSGGASPCFGLVVVEEVIPDKRE